MGGYTPFLRSLMKDEKENPGELSQDGEMMILVQK